jgi:hypothetical protein
LASIDRSIRSIAIFSRQLRQSFPFVVSSSTARPHSSPRGVRHDARHRASARDRGDDAAAVRVRVHVVVRVVVARVERARRPIIIIIIIIIITVASGAFYHHTGPHTTPFAM